MKREPQIGDRVRITQILDGSAVANNTINLIGEIIEIGIAAINPYGVYFEEIRKKFMYSKDEFELIEGNLTKQDPMIPAIYLYRIFIKNTNYFNRR